MEEGEKRVWVVERVVGVMLLAVGFFTIFEEGWGGGGGVVMVDEGDEAKRKKNCYTVAQAQRNGDFFFRGIF